MLAKATHSLPVGGHLSYEPKWDGFRCIVFRDGGEVMLGSRNDRPLTRYFPELLDPIRDQLPDRVVVDGELVVVTDHGLDFDQLGQRIHPAASRVNRLAVETPAGFVAFDLLALDDADVRAAPFRDRRRLLEAVMEGVEPPLFITPTTTDPVTAKDWFERFEGAGFDGVIAKPLDGAYQENVRAQHKVKHLRTADMVVAGYREHADGQGIGSLLLGLNDGHGALHHVGVASAFSRDRRHDLIAELAPHVIEAGAAHPWAQWGAAESHGSAQRMPGAPSRWTGSRDRSWVPLDCQLIVEVAYEGLQNGTRLRHPARFVRWRPDKTAEECRYDQLEQVAPAELGQIFGSGSRDQAPRD